MLFCEKYGKAIDFLLEKSNIAVRYRVTRELCDGSNPNDLENLQEELIYSERAVRLINCLKNRKEYHGSTLYAVENSLNMLVDVGFQYGKGFSEFDEVINELADEARELPVDKNHVLRHLSHIVVVPFLLRAGFRDEWVKEFTIKRICLIHDFVTLNQYDIYDDILKYKSIPKCFRNRPIVRPDLYENGWFKIPLEYDIYGFACLMPELTVDLQSKVNDIISYILDSRFQAIKDGYGILADKKRYWAMGWDPKPTDLRKDYRCNPILLKLDLLGRFSVAANSEWFTQALKLINEYTDESGIYHFPKSFLTEKDSNWILGSHMGLGENRRRKDALTIEGTFRALVIMKNILKEM
ncbi:MAG TPA: hypothetical protein DEF39_08120 [Hungateiclostridium thermocellum]|uniref:Uncharacterized protein n=1 Tax=Acetivibrio thermocellus (strain ATCC 27405 / DSM 1237 / JCM 9322 / NBRC 103400 / NCIMB 10682 / NRRL B-4536 / VPI 7372) TaxID=203119 RepID=A3DFI3_ACET2|nr:hypothetical protein [Acetivibrio thermocellus]ABN52712.1 hypothetical protein Cthe_1483 [Acetivibrio thermocellus ATCC 27405]HBW27224.1 hypothetical protein [Acetivibrio thermocellus]